MSQITNAEKNIAEMLEAEHDSVLPRMATVVESKGRMVRVRYAHEAEAGETWYPSTISNLATGTTGVVEPLRGNASYFQPVGFSLPIHTTHIGSNTPLNTTHVGTAFSNFSAAYALALSDIIPEADEGIWDVSVSASGLLYRSVSTGGAFFGVGVAGGDNGSSLARNFPQTGGFTIMHNRHMNGLAPTDVIEIRFAGFSTAGTTNLVTWSALVTAVRKG